ncbi:MAG: DUF2460 domain-containing protein [Pseudomonadota bacterium]
MSFHDVQFPTNLSFGASGGPEARTEIVTLANGFEERNTPWSESRRRYDAGLAVQDLDDLSNVISFFEARRGPLYAFRWKDWSDFKSCAPLEVPHFTDQIIGTGDDATTVFQITKTYQSGEYAHLRHIQKPVQDTVFIGVSGDEVLNDALYSIDYDAGLITLAEPLPEGSILSAGYEFDVPVRFQSEGLDVNIASFTAGEVPSIPVVEVRI